MAYHLALSGLAQYSGDPRIEWHLNAFTTKESVIDAVKNLPYKGGNTLTGSVLAVCRIRFREILFIKHIYIRQQWMSQSDLHMASHTQSLSSV